MDDGDGAFTLELQAYKIAQNATIKGSRLCPQCGIVMDPREYMMSVLCQPCTTNRQKYRTKGRA